MKNKILATIYTLIIFSVMFLIGYTLWFFPEKWIWILPVISGSVFFVSMWIIIYKHLKD